MQELKRIADEMPPEKQDDAEFLRLIVALEEQKEEAAKKLQRSRQHPEAKKAGRRP